MVQPTRSQRRLPVHADMSAAPRLSTRLGATRSVTLWKRIWNAPHYIIRVAQTWSARKKRRLPCNDRTRTHQGICRYLRFCRHTLLRRPPPATKATRLCAPFARAASWALHDFLTSALHSAGTRVHTTPGLSDSICADLGVRTPVSCGMNIGKVPVRCCVIETGRPQLPSAPTAERSSPALLIFSKSK